MNSKLWKIGLIAGVHVAVIGSIMVFESCKPKSKVAAGPPPGATPIAPLPETAPPPPPVSTMPVLPPVETKPAFPVALKETTHSVGKGDTLSGIAHKYGTTVTAIKGANNLSGDVIRVGQKLKIPTPQESGQKVVAHKSAAKKKAAPKKAAAAPAGAGAVNAEGQYVVAAGDTPDKIAKKLTVKLQALMDANPGLDPKKLQIGQKLNVPGGAAPAAAGAAPAAHGIPLPEAVPAPTVPTPGAPEGAAPGLATPPALPPPPRAPSTPPPGPAPGN
ncbi:MAG: LysM peptidoglycan-binding domain-containing protein [Verrucomicrobia bacterium]|nr:LysM peptidoglycan-binding domain-containing protein [Verrucomicrobiota bacterium]